METKDTENIEEMHNVYEKKEKPLSIFKVIIVLGVIEFLIMACIGVLLYRSGYRVEQARNGDIIISQKIGHSDIFKLMDEASAKIDELVGKLYLKDKEIEKIKSLVGVKEQEVNLAMMWLAQENTESVLVTPGKTYSYAQVQKAVNEKQEELKKIRKNLKDNLGEKRSIESTIGNAVIKREHIADYLSRLYPAVRFAPDSYQQLLQFNSADQKSLTGALASSKNRNNDFVDKAIKSWERIVNSIKKKM